MMINLTDLCYILIAHWVADFIFQSRAVAENKSKSLIVLSEHAALYTLFTMWLMIIFNSVGLIKIEGLIILWAIFNGIAHWVVDFFSSRATAQLWKTKNVHGFFCVVGLDQILHVIMLAGSYAFLKIAF